MGKHLRAATYDDYGLDKHRYLELVHFCRQYDQMKKRIRYGLKAVSNDGMPHGYEVGRPTEQAAIRNHAAELYCGLIESAAYAAMKGLPDTCYHALMICVTQGIPYRLLPEVPLTQKDFYARRRLFFGILNTRRAELVGGRNEG